MPYTSYQLGEMVAQAAARYGINPRIAVEQIRQESGFNPNARSPQGAMGIAQFMPGTARAYGLTNPFDPVAAIDAYARHMRDLLRQFGGDYRLALAAYHSGAGAARAALANPAGNPRTNHYVSTIMSRAGAAAGAVASSLPDFNNSLLPDSFNLDLSGGAGVLVVGLGAILLIKILRG